MKCLITILFSLHLLLLCSCSEPSSSSSRKQPPPALDLSEAALVFATEFEQATFNGDKQSLREWIDLEILIQRSLKGIDLPTDFMRGARESFPMIETRMIDDFTSARYDFIKLVEGGHEPVLRFRIRRDGTLDYADYVFGQPQGRWQLLDANVYSTGTKVTELMRDMMIPALAEIDRSILDRLFARQSTSRMYVDNLPKLQQGILLARSRNPESAQKAIHIYHALPPEIQHTRFGQLMYIIAAAGLPDALAANGEYAHALASFERHFPNDPASALFAIDQTVLSGDFQQTHEVLTKLKSITEDDYIDFYRGFIYLHQKAYDQAEQCARNWIDQHPNDIEGWELLLEVGYAADQHAITVAALTELETKFALDYSAVATAEGWEAFRNSPEGVKWLRIRSQ